MVGMRKISTFLFSLILFGLMIMPTSLVVAQEPTPVTDDQVNEVASQLYCPVCENISLDVCATTACAQWRDLIRSKLEAGWSKDQIEAYFATQYGDRVLAAPPKRGMNWLVYILPPAVVLLGLVFLTRSVQRMRLRAVSQPEPVVSDKDLADVEAELNARKENHD
jgi:cytochrome c-type biogenesis protein CcmH